MKKIILLAAVATLSACAAHAPSTQISELDEARTWIAKAKAAGAEKCAPALQAKAVAYFHHAAHEYSEVGFHPDENAELTAKSVAAAKAAYNKTQNGCKPMPIALKGVNFHTNSAELTADSVATLNRAVQTLKDNPDIHAEVAAHTDSQGKDSYNLDLSNRRAASVMNYLVDHGIDATRLSSKGYGETQPTADNATAEGRAQNRRVELRIK